MTANLANTTSALPTLIRPRARSAFSHPALMLPSIARRILPFMVCAAFAGNAAAAEAQDPYEPLNRSIYRFNEQLDRWIMKPVAQGYDTVLPVPVKIMAGNFFSNLNDVTVTVNDLLQLKFAQAASDGSRVLFNTTFGIGGLLDVTERLPKHKEDFGQTMGYWGVPAGPYVMLPFFGPSSVRDGAGLYADSYTNVIWNIQDIPTRNSLYATSKVDARAQLLKQEEVLEEVGDRYTFLRDVYLRNRENLVYDGNPPRERYIDEEDE